MSFFSLREKAEIHAKKWVSATVLTPSLRFWSNLGKTHFSQPWRGHFA